MIAKETDCLTPEQRAEVDEAIALEAAQLCPGQVRDAVRARVLAVDSEAAAKRAARCRDDRQVGIVNKADGVALLFARLPAEDARACWQALDDHARSTRARGDQRSLNDIRCDTFLQRFTGADPAAPKRVEIGLVVSAASWLGLDDTPGRLVGHGAIHPDVVRDIVDGADTWMRRVFTDPITCEVLTIDSRARRVTGALRTFGTYRDQVCRRPYCTNPITDFNHVREFGQGGRTNHRNTDGLCASCHRSRHQVGWRQWMRPDSSRVWWMTPTGHSYPSDPPPALGHGTASATLLRTLLAHSMVRRRPAA